MKKNFNRVLSMLIALVMVISLVPVVATAAAITPDYSWYNADAENLEISTPAQLKAFDNILNAADGQTADDFSGQTVKLMDNIDLNPGVTVEQMKTAAPNNAWLGHGQFRGTFDGNGKTVSGIYINASTTQIGFLGRTTGSANVTVKNLTISNSYFKLGDSQSGILIGNNGSTGTLTVTDVTVNTTEVAASGNNIGLVGRHYNKAAGTLIMSGCNIADTVTIAGGESVGGLVGYVQTSKATTIENCTVSATISGETGVGGLIGKIKEGAATTVKNCTNNGAISATVKKAAGIVGLLEAAVDLTMFDCNNYGKITAPENAGYLVPGKISVVPLGDQSKDNGNGTKDYRIVSLVYGYDETNPIGIGYKYTVTYTTMEGNATEEIYYCSKAYKAINAGEGSVVAADYGADFFVTLIFRAVPDNISDITVEVTPFTATDAENIVDGAEAIFNWNVSAQ